MATLYIDPNILCSFDFNEVNLDMNFVEGFIINFSEFSFSTTGAGIIMTNTNNANMYSTSINDNTTNGMSMTDCSKIAFHGCDISGNGSSGIELISGCNDNTFNGIPVFSNGASGITLTATSDRNSFSQITVKDNTTYGINIVANTCNDNILLGVIADGNGTASINDVGTGTLKNAAVNILP